MRKRKGAEAYFLHSDGEGVLRVLQSRIHIFFASDLIPHLDALIVEDLVGLLDFFWRVFDDHGCSKTMFKQYVQER